ncbi:methionyl-tRNA formyltransferase [Holdemania massiliensis]|uniref:methionyl-tRNA formyltransferase n=1 Tax=Holdemania massiliensis TaxID=1468449 RepID=UPI001F05CF20|nr:methionyl-tRNA formyltransferase [Holdemania massiliensis]MCH1940569.1 methionyl-tRNA formyltransferase [Holdemania massiliensis]
MKTRVLFMGTPEFACGILQALTQLPFVELVGVVSQPDKKVGRQQKLQMTPVHALAEQLGLPVLQPQKIRTDYAEVLDLQPELIVTCAYGQMVPEAVLNAPKHGCINVHASLLPKYRGGSPIHTAIIQGETESGVTIMQMVKKMDAGDMLAVKKVAIDEEDTTEMLHDKLQAAGSALLKECLLDYLEGRITPIAQDETQVSFAWNITKEQEQIDFSQTGRQIYNQIRGLISWPVGYGVIAGQKMKFWGVRYREDKTEQPSGTILGFDEMGMLVAAGGVMIVITELQMEGKKRVGAKDFYNGKGKQLIGCRFESVTSTVAQVKESV